MQLLKETSSNDPPKTQLFLFFAQLNPKIANYNLTADFFYDKKVAERLSRQSIPLRKKGAESSGSAE